MTDCLTAYNFAMDSEDPQRLYATVDDPTDAVPAAQAIAGINSAEWPEQFAAVAALAPGVARAGAVEAFYRQYFWKPWLAQMDSATLALHVFDGGVNEGLTTVVKLLQQAANAMGQLLTVDGQVGPLTLAAVNELDGLALFLQFTELRCAAYRNIGGPNVAAWIARARR